MSSIVEHRVVAVPRIGDGFIAVLSDLVEVLIALEGESRSKGGLALPAALTDGSALGALDRLASVLIPTQTARCPRLFGREGREYPSIVFVEIQAPDLQLLGVVVQAIGMAHLRDERRVGERLAEIMSVSWARPSTPADLIAGFASLHGLLDLAWTEDTSILFAALQAAPPACPEITLRHESEQAYRRLARRLSGMWGGGWSEREAHDREGRAGTDGS